MSGLSWREEMRLEIKGFEIYSFFEQFLFQRTLWGFEEGF